MIKHRKEIHSPKVWMTKSEYSLIKNINDQEYINVLALRKSSLLVISQEDFLLCIWKEEGKTIGSFSTISFLYSQEPHRKWTNLFFNALLNLYQNWSLSYMCSPPSFVPRRQQISKTLYQFFPDLACLGLTGFSKLCLNISGVSG